MASPLYVGMSRITWWYTHLVEMLTDTAPTLTFLVQQVPSAR